MKPFRGQDGKYHVLYKVTNLLNNRFYIGRHSTRILEDGYMGSGTRIRLEIKKYGVNNFIKEYLNFFNNKDILSSEEAKIVDDKMIANPQNLNIAKGGTGGDWKIINSNPELSFKCKSKGGKKAHQLRTPEKYSEIAKKVNAARKRNGTCAKPPSFEGMKHTNETRAKMPKTHRENKHQSGEKNSQFGKMWIYNLETFKSIKIYKNDFIPEGWSKGRKICQESRGKE